MSEIALHVTGVLHGYGYDYSGCMAIVDEIIQACEVLGLAPEEFDNTIANYRTQYSIKPSGWRALARFRPRQSDCEKRDQQARNHIFCWIEREGWRRGLGVIYEGICGQAPRLLAEQWGLDVNGPEYAGLPEVWRQYFELLHNGNMYAAYLFMAHSMVADSCHWQQLANQAALNPEQALTYQPYLKRLVESGKVELVSPLCEKRTKRRWVIPSRKENNAENEPPERPGEFLFE